MGGYIGELISVNYIYNFETIGERSFYAAATITELELQNEELTSIGNYAFSFCRNLSTVTFQSTTPPTFGSSYVFSSCSALTAIKVPSSAVQAYKTALQGLISDTSIVQAI